MTTKMKIEQECYGLIDKEVSPATSSSGRIYVPVEWVGKKVRILLLEE